MIGSFPSPPISTAFTFHIPSSYLVFSCFSSSIFFSLSLQVKVTVVHQIVYIYVDKIETDMNTVDVIMTKRDEEWWLKIKDFARTTILFKCSPHYMDALFESCTNYMITSTWEIKIKLSFPNVPKLQYQICMRSNNIHDNFKLLHFKDTKSTFC